MWQQGQARDSWIGEAVRGRVLRDWGEGVRGRVVPREVLGDGDGERGGGDANRLSGA